MLFRLSLHFDRADSFGDKYQRYNLVTEQLVAAHLDDPTHFYAENGKLKPAFKVHLNQLRDLLAFNDEIGRSAADIRSELKSLKPVLTEDRGVQLRPE